MVAAQVCKQTLVARLEDLTRDIDPPPPSWVWDMSNRFVLENYCPDHIAAAVAAASVSGLWSDDPTLDPPHADGGYTAEISDSSIACATCGRTLAYVLSGYGASEEIAHFLQSEGQLTAVQAWELLAAVEAAPVLSEKEVGILAALVAPTTCVERVA